MVKPWLWPDHAIGKRESRRLRDEHNEAVNLNAEMLEALRKWNESHKAYETAIGEDPGLVSVWLRKADALRYDAFVLTRAAIGKTEGKP